MAAFIFSDQPISSATDSAFVHDWLGQFSVTITTAHQSYHRNQQYSIIAVKDETGGILERYSYSAYGDPTFFNGSGSQISESAISNRYTYTGRKWDGAIRLYHYRARMYDPQLGRFTARDPIEYNGGSLLLYQFIGNRPLAELDPYGLFSLSEMFAAYTAYLGNFIHGNGATVFGQKPFFMWPGPPPGGLFVRIQTDFRMGACDCPCGNSGTYVSKKWTIELGVFLGVMVGGFNVAVPILENRRSCPESGVRITGGITTRVVAGPLVGTCRSEHPDWWPQCNFNFRITGPLGYGLNVQFSGHITILMEASDGC